MTLRIAAPLIAMTLAAPALAAPGGALETLPNGEYVCETPGDAGGPVGHLLPDAGFRIVNASSYAVGQARGTYLATDDVVIMTSGPFKGRTFRRRSETHLVRSDESGQRVRCVRTNRDNG